MKDLKNELFDYAFDLVSEYMHEKFPLDEIEKEIDNEADYYELFHTIHEIILKNLLKK